jgi:hypothetical protein
MARWIGITLLAALLAGCGIDQGKLATAADSARTTTTTTAPSGTTGPGHTIEPSQRASAEDLLLDQGDLGTEWTEGGTGTDAVLPNCAQASTGADPADEANKAFVGGGVGAVLLQRAAVYASAEKAHQALAAFRAGLDACDNVLVHVDDLPLPDVGDEVEAARLQLGGNSVGVPFDLACVRVEQRVSCLTYLASRQGGSDQFPTLVKAAAAKLG